MKFIRWITAAALVLAALAAAATAAPKTTVSVMDLNTSSGLSQKELVLLTDKLLNSLVEYRVFEVVERSKRDEILKEQGFQMTGACSEASCLVEVGQLLGAQKMIGGTIGTLGGVFVVELRMIDIKTGGIDLTFSRTYGRIADLLGAMREAAEIFSAWKPAGAGGSAKPGGLFIVSEPEGAKILVDGQERPGATPDLVYPLDEGLHQVSLVKDGYSLYSASRLVSVGKVDTLNAPLMSLAGKLRISTAPSGAKVYLGKKYQGTSTEQPMVIEDLSDTAYQLRVQKWGYRRYRSMVRMTPGHETKANVSLPLARWVMRYTVDFIWIPEVASYDQTASIAGSAQVMTVDANDLKGAGGGGTAGVGFALTRNITLSLLYQFRVMNGIIDKRVQNWTDTMAQNDDLRMGFKANSLLGALTVAVPWGRLEPYGEVRFGGMGAKSNGEYQRQYLSRTSVTSTDWTTDSTFQQDFGGPVKYLTFQAGGGAKLWLQPNHEAIQVYWMYSRDMFSDIDCPALAGKIDLAPVGHLFGAGFSVNF